ncbi:Macrolide export protein like [Actinidia chinensis var. chinensis]|uniref:Macrolide export protein like n=1 Tax=Actinidia chinensis var. chinensis TaxID=1590841 RepID=A0A2R6PEK4_ACTCC|nr:Macrolide export protein like [Actinidia chinensis var. chinensis]
MGWSHPDISLEDLMKLIKGFVDILILASGYQSSGSLAHWDPQNIKKAFQWGLFFENVLKRLRCSDDYQDLEKQLDAALTELKSNTFFPQGLAHLSSVTLHRAGDFVLEHLIRALPLRDTHLKAFMISTIEMDLDELRRTGNDCLDVYLNKLMLQNSSMNPDLDRIFMEDSAVLCEDVAPNMKTVGDFTKFTIQEVIKRQSAVSCINCVEAGLDILHKAITESNWKEFDHVLKHDKAPQIEEHFIEYDTWNCWKTRALSYFLDKRTIRLVSGASMIFSASEVQWAQVFEKLNISAETSDDDSRDTIEILLLGCIASRWSSLVEHFMSVSYDFLTTLKQYQEVCSLLPGRSQNLHSREGMVESKGKGILDYLTVLLRNQPHQLWKLSPALVAVAIPFWSPLFRLYLNELEDQFKGGFSTTRCCNCAQNSKVHKDCELAERIWCLYIYHVCGSYLISGTNFT